MRVKVIVLGVLIAFFVSCEKKAADDFENLKKAQIDILQISTAIIDYIFDNAVAPEQSGMIIEGSPLFLNLVPAHIRNLPIKDPWGGNYYVYCGNAMIGQYGFTEAEPDDFLVISYGKDGIQESWKYDPLNPEAGLYYQIDYDNDLVIFNGGWVRAPK